MNHCMKWKICPRSVRDLSAGGAGQIQNLSGPVWALKPGKAGTDRGQILALGLDKQAAWEA